MKRILKEPKFLKKTTKLAQRCSFLVFSVVLRCYEAASVGKCKNKKQFSHFKVCACVIKACEYAWHKLTQRTGMLCQCEKNFERAKILEKNYEYSQCEFIVNKFTSQVLIPCFFGCFKMLRSSIVLSRFGIICAVYGARYRELTVNKVNE